MTEPTRVFYDWVKTDLSNIASLADDDEIVILDASGNVIMACTYAVLKAQLHASPGAIGGTTPAAVTGTTGTFVTLRCTAESELTISGGEITITQSMHRVDTESDAASDDLVTINGGVANTILFIRAENASRTVVLKDGTGNLELGGSDVSLDDTDAYVILIYDATLTKWVLASGGGETAAGALMADDFTQDGGILVGTGAGTFAEETGATARTSLGLTDPILDKASPGAIGGTTPAAVTGTTGTFNDLVVDTDLIYADGTNHLVGIETTSPVFTLDVNGKINQSVAYYCEEFAPYPSSTEVGSTVILDNYWVQGGTNHASANVTIKRSRFADGYMHIVTSGGDDDSESLISCGAMLSNERDGRFETLISLGSSSYSTVFVGVGLVEGAFTDKASMDDDIILVGIDTDLGDNNLRLWTNDNNAGVVTDDLGVEWSSSNVRICIDISDTEQPRIFINGTEIAAGLITGTIQSGINWKLYYMIQQLAGSVTRSLDVWYYKTWQDRQ